MHSAKNLKESKVPGLQYGSEMRPLDDLFFIVGQHENERNYVNSKKINQGKVGDQSIPVL